MLMDSVAKRSSILVELLLLKLAITPLKDEMIYLNLH
jgi:hypothetical protein